jgi:fructosamine-3-kinase
MPQGGPARADDHWLKRGDPNALAREAAGLAWLAEAQPVGGAQIVPVLHHGNGLLVEPRLQAVPAGASAAATFGRELARTHAAGADGHMQGPPGIDGPGWIGRARMPLAAAQSRLGWRAGYLDYRVRPYLRAVGSDGAALLERLAQRLLADDGSITGPEPAPARLHGDLWTGNVIWTRTGVVLIDPAAHGGHPETDLAMLALFGCPRLDSILAGYQEVSPLADGWRERVALHQLYPLLVHAQLFGGGYVAQALAAARRYL